MIKIIIFDSRLMIMYQFTSFAAADLLDSSWCPLSFLFEYCLSVPELEAIDGVLYSEFKPLKLDEKLAKSLGWTIPDICKREK